MQLLIFAFPFNRRSFGLYSSPVFPFRVVGSNGLGPSTSRLSGVCSNQLSYEPIYGGGNRVRTDDPLLAGQVLYQLSYTPIIVCNSLFCKINATYLKVACKLLKTNKKETISFFRSTRNGQDRQHLSLPFLPKRR